MQRANGDGKEEPEEALMLNPKTAHDKMESLEAECARLRLALDNARAALETDAELLQSGRESDRLLAISHMEDAALAAREALGK
jgi:hypothetical protein